MKQKTFAMVCVALLTLCTMAGTWKDPATGITWTYWTSWSAGVEVAQVKGCSPAEGTISIPSSLDGKSVVSVLDHAFSGNDKLTRVEIPSGVLTIENYAFSECTKMTSVVIPPSVTRIGEYAFFRCRSLSGVTIPTSVIDVLDDAFGQCESLTSVTISDGVTNIYSGVFCGCVKLTSILIPASVNYVGDAQFLGCDNLREITVSPLNTKYFSQGGVLFYKNVKHEVYLSEFPRGKQTTSYSIPSGVNYIGSRAFEGSSLTCVTIPFGVEGIGKQAFYGCSDLTDVVIPSSVTHIGDAAFCGSGLTNITIPSSVTDVGDSAFPTYSLRALDFEGAPPYGIEESGIHHADTAIRYNGMYYDDWEAVVNQCEWTNAKPYSPSPFPVGGPYKEEVNGIVWTFTVDDELNASVGSGTYGGYRAVPEATKGAIVIPSTLGGRVVTSIGCYAFRDRSGLTSVAIPSSITIINESAFRGCSGLTTMTIPLNVERIESSAFQECTSLASVAIDAGLKVIEHYAFEDCVALRTVNIPQTVEWVGSSILSGTQYWKDHADGVVVLDGCAIGLKGNAPTQLVIPNGVRLIASSAFYGCLSSSLSLPSSLRVIGGNAFQCSHIVAAELPLGVTTVGGSSFCNCAQLTTVTIPSSVRDIGNDAFMSCGNLATLDMAEGVERIGNNAFYSCKALSNIRIPDSVESIGSNAFYDCTGLWTVEIGLAIKDIGGKAFEGCSELRSFGMYGAPTNLGTWAFGGYGKDYKYLDAIKVKDLQKWCANEFDSNTCLLYFTKYNRSYSKLLLNGEPLPVDLAIPNGVSRVGSRTFQYLSLTSVAMPSEVASIGDRAFSGCQYLTNVLLNAGLKIIEGSAFSDCSRLTRITLPTTVESIGAGTFSGCGVLDAVDFECPPPAGIRNAGVKANATIRYNENYEDEWLPVIVACGWTNATAYQPNPSVPGDPGAVVTGDPENGYTIKPSGSNMNVVVSIPSGVEASKVTVEVSPNVLTVTPNGANVKIVKSTNDITSYLDIPSADPSGTIDLSQATVKSEIVKEALDPAKGAEIELNAESPSLTTSETKPGLTYTLHEGATLQGMNPGDSKVGDGQPWTPNITVKGGSSGFYTIGVTK